MKHDTELKVCMLLRDLKYKYEGEKKKEKEKNIIILVIILILKKELNPYIEYIKPFK